MAASDTLVTLLILVNLVLKCNSDVYNVGDASAYKDEEPERTFAQYDINDTKPERTFTQYDINDTKQERTFSQYDINDTKDYEEIKDEKLEPTTEDQNVSDNKSIDSVDSEDGRRTTIEYATETSYTLMLDNNVYSSNVNDDNMDVNKQTEYETPEPTGNVEEHPADTPSRVEEASDETTGQRSPKTEADTQDFTEQRTLEKPQPPVALNKSSTLKSWLEDSWLRPPAGILVPLRPLALSRALAVWNEITQEGLNITDIVIVGYDSNGISWRSRHNLQPSSTGKGERAVAEALSKLLLKYQDVYTDNMNDGTMRALMSATKLVPYDSALFIITDKGPGDPQRLPLAVRALIEKRLKVYVIWTGPNHPSPESELALQELRNISLHTEGEVLPYSLHTVEEDGASNLASEAELQQWEPMDTTQARQARIQNYPDFENFDTLLVRRGRGEALSLGVPIENGVTALRIYIEGAAEHAVLYPANEDPQIDLFNQSSVQTFSPSSSTINQNPRDVYLVFPEATDEDSLSVVPAKPTEESSRMVGTWHLSIRCDTCEYILQVSARTHLHLHVDVQPKGVLKIQVSGPVASVLETLLIDEYGNELAKLPFSYQPTDSLQGSEAPMAELFADVPLPKVQSPRVYVKILGRDLKGVPFVRIWGPIHQSERISRSAIAFPDSYNDLERVEELNSIIYNSRLQYNDSNILPFGRATSQVLNQAGSILTSVQIGLSSRLYGAPGDRLQLHFEVTNNRDQTVRFNFGAVGELRFLTGIEPASQNVASGQTANVIVNLLITSNAQPGARDLITFTAYGIEQVSLSAYVYVLNTGESIRDIWAPEVSHTFQGTCWGQLGDNCGEQTWSTTITARDAVGGLLRLSSSPLGLIYDSNFISGTREQVVATYRASCCAPRVLINAVDAFGNVNTYTIDISNYITGAGIAAIVLAVVLFILLIIVLVICIYWCVKRRKESRELPSYATNSRQSRHVS